MNRLLAWLLLCGYLCLGLVFIGWSAVALIGLFLVLPLACILWPEIMADAGRGLRPDPLPPEFVFGLGWFLFLLPAILAVLLWLIL